jgi:hypothetical protein
MTDELRERLAHAGVPVHIWGRPRTRSVADLAREVERGECRLDVAATLRRLRIVRVEIERATLLLHELELDEGDGRVLVRDRPPAEKLIGEDLPEVGALRCLEEELGVAAERVALQRIELEGHTRVEDNPGYPGLATEYEVHVARVVVDGLPQLDFETVELEPGPGGRRVVHRWGWR